MLAWLPFFLISLMFIVLLYACARSARTNIQRFKQLSLIAFLWVLTAFCYTPTSYNFGSTFSSLFHWAVYWHGIFPTCLGVVLFGWDFLRG